MTAQRPTLLALVGRSASWPEQLEAWVAADAVPVTMSYCPSVPHLQAQLDAGGRPQAVLLDGDLSLVDRNLLDDIGRAGGRAVVVEGARRRLQWDQLGAAAVLPNDFDERQLVNAVRTVVPAVAEPAVASGPRAPLVAVTGPGGTGASVSAIAIAQGLSAQRRRTVLLDACLHAEQAMLHNTVGTPSGLADLLDLHADRTPQRRELRRMAIGVVERGYYLLPGLARARQWPLVRKGSLAPALDSLRTAFDVVVADVDAEVEGEAEAGSIDVEERNLLARTILSTSDAIVIVGHPTMKGVFSLVRTIVDLTEFGVHAQRILPVMNQAPEDPALRTQLNRAIGHLVGGATQGAAVGPALFAPRVALEDRLREGDGLPNAWPTLLAEAVAAVLARVPSAPAQQIPERVAVGALGHWSDQQ